MNGPRSSNLVSCKVWQAFDAFRGGSDPDSIKDYILPLLLVKYLGDIHKSNCIAYEKKYGGDAVRIQRALSRERFIVPRIEIRDSNDDVEESFPATFDSLYERRTRSNIGELINILLARIESANKGKLHNVFRQVDYNSDTNLGLAPRRNARLKKLLEDLGRLDMRTETVEHSEAIGDACRDLIERFAATAKKAGDFYTPAAVSETLARLVAPRPGDRICDPACGSGCLLIQAGKQVGSGNYAVYGQEKNSGTWALCKMNMILHGMDAARIEWGDTLRHPQLVDGNDLLMKFDVVISNPPFSLDKWGQEVAAEDRFNRFYRGIPPKSKGDWAFISHMLATATEGSGRVGVVVPHGTLFRGGQEGRIRKAVIRENLLDGVIGLPANLFCGSNVPVALLVFDKSRPAGERGEVLFIDASKEFEPAAHQNRLRPRDIEKIVIAFRERRTMDKYSYPAGFREIEANGFDLNISRYMAAFDPEPEIDSRSIQKEVEAIEAELADTQSRINAYLRQLGSID